MKPTIIVAGCTRSGMTMTMQMLHAGGVPCSGEFPAFEPHDMGEIPWNDVQEKAVKLVDSHLQFPPHGMYRVILTSRNVVQQSMSIAKFLSYQGFHLRIDKTRLRESVNRDMKTISDWAYQQESVLELPFEKTLKSPDIVAKQIRDFIGPEYSLDPERAASAVIKRSHKCYPGLMETRWM